jgi:hypothetical protein
MNTPNPLYRRKPERTPAKRQPKVTKGTFARVDAVLRWWDKKEKANAS